MLHRCRIRRSRACGVVRTLVRNRCRRTLRFPFRLSVSVVTTTIQALPGQLALMGSGASLARRFQTVSRPWRLSRSLATKGM
jgi:hypothetical protein